MSHLNFKNNLLARIEKALKLCGSEQVFVMLDNWNILANSCDSSTPELDLLEVFNTLISMAQVSSELSFAIGINRDLFEGPEVPFYREIKQNPELNVVFELNRNAAGYSKDVHGQLNVITHH